MSKTIIADLSFSDNSNVSHVIYKVNNRLVNTYKYGDINIVYNIIKLCDKPHNDDNSYVTANGVINEIGNDKT